MQLHHRTGWIELICGCMFSGKSEELIRRVKRAKIARVRYQVFKPVLDDRYHVTDVYSHDGRFVESIAVPDSATLYSEINPDTELVAVDEVQFFDKGIIDVSEKLANRGIRVILAGLDLDFRGEPFGPMPELLTLAEYTTKLHAICTRCGSPATRTQRLIDGKPAHYNDPVIMVGSAETYEARCRHCHELPGKPQLT
jgi:thymidine kinase